MILTNICRKLIAFQTTADNPQEILNCLQYITDLFKADKTITCKREMYHGKPVLWILPGKKFPSVIGVGHIDVVAGNKSQFSPKVRDGNLVGRGSYDMKMGVAIMISLLLEKIPDFGVVLTADEETGENKNGAYHVAQKLARKKLLIIVPDGEHQLGITIRAKGMTIVKVRANGKGARYSYPWRGDNPYPKLMKFYLSLDRVFPDAKRASDKDPWYTTYNLLSMDAKDGPQVPDTGTMEIIVNFTDEYTKSTLIKKLRTLGKKFDCEIELSFFGNAYRVSPDLPEIQKFKSILKTPFLTMSGISDVRFFHEKGMKTLMIRMDGKDPHGPNESVSILSSHTLYQTLKTFLLTM